MLFAKLILSTEMFFGESMSSSWATDKHCATESLKCFQEAFIFLFTKLPLLPPAADLTK